MFLCTRCIICYHSLSKFTRKADNDNVDLSVSVFSMYCANYSLVHQGWQSCDHNHNHTAYRPALVIDLSTYIPNFIQIEETSASEATALWRYRSFIIIIIIIIIINLTNLPTPDYGLGTVGKCLGPTTSKGPTKDGCKIC